MTPRSLPGHLAPSCLLGGLKANRRLLGRLVFSRTAGAYPDARRSPGCLLLFRPFSAIWVPLRPRLLGALLATRQLPEFRTFSHYWLSKKSDAILTTQLSILASPLSWHPPDKTSQPFRAFPAAWRPLATQRPLSLLGARLAVDAFLMTQCPHVCSALSCQ